MYKRQGEEVARQSEEGFSFRGQEMQLLRAIRNLIDNAVRFSKEGQEIVLEVQEKDGRLIFTVQDSGPGFCQEALAKAGKIFYTSEKHRASEGHLGLGLYSVSYTHLDVYKRQVRECVKFIEQSEEYVWN